MLTDTEILAQAWVAPDDDPDGGGLERAVVEVERSDRDEVRIGVTIDGEGTEHVYLAPDRAVRLAQALIYEASKQWRFP